MAHGEAEKSQYLKGHLSYELLMLRHTHSRLSDKLHPFDWNAFLEAFAVHARNLETFLTNGDGRNNFKACEFVQNFKAVKVSEIVNAINLLDPSVFHMGDQRLKRDKKFDIEDADTVFVWIEKEMLEFVDRLPKELGKYWSPGHADTKNWMHIEVSNHSQSSHSISVGSNLSQTTHVDDLNIVVFDRSK